MPVTSSNLHKAGGPRKRFDSVLLRMGFTYAPVVANEAVVSYTALPPLPDFGTAKIRRILTDSSHAITAVAVYFCCTILGVASTGRYPASCPVKPGLSSPRKHFGTPKTFRYTEGIGPRSFALLIHELIIYTKSMLSASTFYIQLHLSAQLLQI